MLRFLLMPMLALTLLFGAAIGSIRAQPDDAAYRQAVRDFLLPPLDCPSPCWQGIRPGITTLNEALELLDSRGWTGTINFHRGMAMDTGLLLMEWSGQQPAFIDPEQPALFWIEANIVERMAVRMNIPYADAWRSLSMPERGAVSIGSTSPPIFNHYAGYHDTAAGVDFVLYSAENCPFNPQRLWNARFDFLLGATQDFDFSEYDLPLWLHDPVC